MPCLVVQLEVVQACTDAEAVFGSKNGQVDGSRKNADVVVLDATNTTGRQENLLLWIQLRVAHARTKYRKPMQR